MGARRGGLSLLCWSQFHLPKAFFPSEIEPKCDFMPEKLGEILLFFQIDTILQRFYGQNWRENFRRNCGQRTFNRWSSCSRVAYNMLCNGSYSIIFGFRECVVAILLLLLFWLYVREKRWLATWSSGFQHTVHSLLFLVTLLWVGLIKFNVVAAVPLVLLNFFAAAAASLLHPSSTPTSCSVYSLFFLFIQHHRYVFILLCTNWKL